MTSRPRQLMSTRRDRVRRQRRRHSSSARNDVVIRTSGRRRLLLCLVDVVARPRSQSRTHTALLSRTSITNVPCRPSSAMSLCARDYERGRATTRTRDDVDEAEEYAAATPGAPPTSDDDAAAARVNRRRDYSVQSTSLTTNASSDDDGDDDDDDMEWASAQRLSDAPQSVALRKIKAYFGLLRKIKF